MDLFNRKKIKELEDKIYSLKLTARYNESTIIELKKDLAPYVTYKDRFVGRDVFSYKYTLQEAEQDIRERDLYISVLEGELGLEKTNSAKNKYKALKEIVINNTLQQLTSGDKV